jgi:hypothetical protein
MHGFVAGREKTVLETKDGGKSWKSVPAAKEPTGNANFAVYSHIAFLNSQVGLIAGSAVPPVRSGLSANNRQIPTMTLQIQTFDGGKTWKPSSAPLLGVVDGLKLQGGEGLVLFTFSNQFEVPSEVYRLSTNGGDAVSAFRARNRRVTSMALFKGHAFLAAIEPPPLAKEVAGLPGKVHVLESTDLKEWTELPVDYRANAARAILAGPDAEHQFIATDEGMILRFIP